MKAPIFEKFYKEDGIINKKSYLEHNRKDFEEIDKLINNNITTALLFFVNELPSEVQSKCQFLYMFKSAASRNPVYIYDNKFIIALTPLGGPAATGLMEELGFMGINKFFACGSAGQINYEIDSKSFIVVNSAIRDEGTSYHYLKPSVYVETNSELTKELEKYLSKRNFEFIKSVVWTTDAFYRETPKIVEKRLKQNAVCVDMECASLCAVAKFRGYKFAQLLYFSDVVKQEGWK